MSQKIRKVASNIDSDGKSFIFSGNLLEVPTHVDSIEEENDFIEVDDDFDMDEKKVSVASNQCTLDDYQAANRLCDEFYGVNLLEILTKLLLNNDLDVKEFVVQSLAYKIQAMTRGTSGIRYQKGWGMFWAATRNLVRSRGIVAFRDHFCVPSPSQLAKYQQNIIETCGLKRDNVGRPGIQSKTAELWVNSKKVAAGTDGPCLTVSMDAKRIAVTDKGVEDLAGLGSTHTNEEESDLFEQKIQNIEELIRQGERKGLYTALDAITVTNQQLSKRLDAIEQLLVKNSRLLEKNPLVSKYIYVLNNQLVSGQKIIENANEVQSQLLDAIAVKRNCKNLRPIKETLNIVTQKNFLPLPQVSEIVENSNFECIRQSLANGLFDIKWSNLETQLSDNSSKFSRKSETFKHLLRICFLSSETIHASCGLGRSTPLLDMKNAWERTHTALNNSKLPIPVPTSPDLVATFCSCIAIVLFGQNAMVHEGGIYIKNGICAMPDLVVKKGENIIYTVHMFKSSNNIFEISEEEVVTCLADSYISCAEKGAIAVLYNENMCVAIHVSPENQIVQRMLLIFHSFIKSPKCIMKRSSEMLKQSKEIQRELNDKSSKAIILGSFPVVKNSQESSEISASGSRERVPVSISDFRFVMQGARAYLSKKAKELVALNISDLSGNPSQTPHTILGATYLTSSSLKLVGRQCLEEVCGMLTKNGAKVLNIGVDGESLYLASVLPNGSPGTLQTLVKHLNDKLKAVKKEKLIELVTLNSKIELAAEITTDNYEEDEDNEDLESCPTNVEQITEEVLESAALLESVDVEKNKYTIEDVEEMLVAENENKTSENQNQRRQVVKSFTLAQLRILCLKYLLPKAKRVWLDTSIGMESFNIHFDDGETLNYVPNTVFEKIDDKYFRTVSFDYAHIINLFREHAAKGRLYNLGLDLKVLEDISQQPGYEYLKKIIAVKGNKLVFDSMNQVAAATLFSKKTALGLEALGHKNAAQCVQIISDGLAALDESGIDVKARIMRINSLKLFLEEKNDMIQRVKRADTTEMTNELLQMVLTTLDSFVYTSMSMEYFSVRRKGTGTVEQLFGQMTMMMDGCGKLDVRQLKDILKRLTLTNALRLTPQAVRGFKFLNQLRQHMKSYKPDDFDDSELVIDRNYPALKAINRDIHPSNALFDIPKKKKKKRILFDSERQPHIDDAGDKVRKFTRKF